MPRETFILCDDIASGQIGDFHAKPGTNLEKLVNKKVIDVVCLSDVPVPANDTSVRVDLRLLDQPHAALATDVGLITSRKHQVFRANTDNAFADAAANEVVGNLVFTASVSFSIALTTGSNLGTTVGDPGDVQIGDYVRVQGQGTVSDFISQITDKVASGPDFILTFVNNFVQGISTTYTAERINRWNFEFKDSSDVLFPMPGDNADLGIFKRVEFGDISENYGQSLLKRPELAPEVSAGNMTCATVEVELDPGETFLWFHGANFDIPLLSWWVEWTSCYPIVRFFFGLQATTSFFLESQVQCPPTFGATIPVKFKHIDENFVEIINENTVVHRVKAIVCKPITG